MFCSKCGQELKEGEYYCPKCGVKNVLAETTVFPLPAKKIVPKPVAIKKYLGAKKKRKRTVLTVIIAVSILAIMGFVSVCVGWIHNITVLPKGEQIAKVYTRGTASYIITDKGNLYGWGNWYGMEFEYTQLTPKNLIEDVKEISMESDDYVIVLKHDDSLWAWGANPFDEYYDGRPITTKIMDNVKLFGGNYALKKDNSLWAISHNSFYSCGISDKNKPVKVLNNVIEFSDHHALQKDGTFWAWHKGKPEKYMENVMAFDDYHALQTDGSLWNWKSYDRYDEMPVKFMDGIIKFEGNSALKEDGSLWIWDDYGETDSSKAIKILDRVKSFSGHNALKDDGSVWSWSYSNKTPEKVIENVKEIYWDTDYALKDDGSLWSWENGTPASKVIDSVVHAVSDVGSTLALKEDGTLWVWGNNQWGQLGSGTKFNVAMPIMIMQGERPTKIIAENDASEKTQENQPAPLPSNSTPLETQQTKPLESPSESAEPATATPGMQPQDVKIETGYYTSFLVKSDGSLWGWGQNEYYQMGDGTKENSLVPKKLMDNVINVDAEEKYTLALKNDGSLWGWGFMDDRKIGETPVKIMDGVKEISVSTFYFLALAEDGNVWYFSSRQHEPAVILDSAESILAEGCNCLKADGSVWRWSVEYTMQPMPEAPTPTKYMDNVKQNTDGLMIKQDGSLWSKDSKIIDGVIASFDYGPAYALKDDGSLWRIDRDDDNDSEEAIFKEPVKILDNVKAAMPGLDYTIAIQIDGSIWVWTDIDEIADVYDGLTVNSKPQKVMDGVKMATGAKGHVLVIKEDGSLWAWGENANGQIGIGIAGDSWLPPTKIMDLIF